jgi:hypothetical protein
MCKVIIVNQMQYLEKYIKEARGYVARGLFYNTSNEFASAGDKLGIHVYKEKFKENNFDKIDLTNAVPPFVFHCRQPTCGSPQNNNNNHPFIFPRKEDTFAHGEEYLYSPYRTIIGCQVGFTDNNIWDSYRLGQCDSESAIIALSLLKDPVEFCNDYVKGQLFFFSKDNDSKSYKFFMYNPMLEEVEGGFATVGIRGEKIGFFQYDLGQHNYGNIVRYI